MAAQPPLRGPPSEEAMKTRIITHMNADHQDSLVRYLEHYSHVPSYRANYAHLVDISLAWMLISTSPSARRSASSSPSTTSLSKSHSAHAHFIPLDPPLSSYSEYRQRVVDMDKLCTIALNRSPITVKRYIPPHGVRAAIAMAVLVTYALLSTKANVDPGRSGWLMPRLVKERTVPSFFAFLKTVRLLILVPTLAVHLCEDPVEQNPLSANHFTSDHLLSSLSLLQATYMARTRLRKHSVPQFSLLWWKWVVSTFVDGFGNFVDFDKIVADEIKRKEKASH